VDVDTDALDEDPNTAHIYVTYDSPASRHTLAVARIVLDADPTAPPRAFAKATRLLSTAAAKIPGDSATDNIDNLDNPGTDTGLGGVGDYGALRACVDRFAATGRASIIPFPLQRKPPPPTQLIS